MTEKKITNEDAKNQLLKYQRKFEKNYEKNSQEIKDKFNKKIEVKDVWTSKTFFSNLKKLYKKFLDPETPAHTKIIIGAALLYFISPFDLIFDFLPIIGYLDDVAVISYAVYLIKDILDE